MSNLSPHLVQLLATIRKLSPRDRRVVANYIRAQDGSELSAADMPRHSEDWLLPGLEAELRKRGVLTGPLSIDRLSMIASDYGRDSAQIRAALKAKIKEPITQAELLALGRKCAKALADYKVAEATSYCAFGPKMLLRSVSEIPVALDRSFPGYLAAGMLLAIVRGLK